MRESSQPGCSFVPRDGNIESLACRLVLLVRDAERAAARRALTQRRDRLAILLCTMPERMSDAARIAEGGGERIVGRGPLRSVLALSEVQELLSYSPCVHRWGKDTAPRTPPRPET